MTYTRRLLAATAISALLGVAAAAQASTVFTQGFEQDSAGWSTTSGGHTYGALVRVYSGANNIPAAQGSIFALVGSTGTGQPGPFTDFGGFRSTWTGGWTASLDIYLDTAWTSGQGFNYAVAANDRTGTLLRNFVFHVAADTPHHQLLVNASTDYGYTPVTTLPALADSVAITSSGWYTFTSQFTDDNGALAATLRVSNGTGTIFSKTLANPADLISQVGGNRYGWFTAIGVNHNGWLAIDNTQLILMQPATLPLPTSAAGGLLLLASLGGAWRLRRPRPTT